MRARRDHECRAFVGDKLKRPRREGIEAALRSFAEQCGLKPRDAFQPIRLAVTGSKVSPGLFESLELLGKEETLARIGGSGRGEASGSSAR